jgi:hypothetical protein
VTPGALDLVDPTACARESHPLAPRPRPGTARSLVLADGILNRRSLWGAGMLDAAERVLSSRAAPRPTFDRDELNPLDVRPGELWVRPLLEGHDGLVLAAGDCLTCTSRAARNLAIGERLGLPGALVCTAGAEAIARTVAQGVGLPDLYVLPVEASLFGRTRAEIADLVEPALGGLAAALGLSTTTGEDRAPHTSRRVES